MARPDPTLVIAEIASSHEGREALAGELVQAAAAAGADAIKFQLFRADQLVVAHHPKIESFRLLEFAPEVWARLAGAAHALGLRVYADVYDRDSLAVAVQCGVDGYKIPATIVGDEPLVEAIAATGKPLLVAISGESEEEIAALLHRVGVPGRDSVVLLHGFQGFPTAIADTNLARLTWLRRVFGLPVGFADHSPGDLAVSQVLPVISVGLGATVVEKHLTWDRSAKGRDHVSALNPDEFRRMVGWIRETEAALGGDRADISAAEIAYREAMNKKVVAAAPRRAGMLVGEPDVALRRSPDAALPAARAREVVGRVLVRDVAADAPVRPDDVAPPRSVVLVAVRMKSTRLPRKALLDLAGKPVLAHLIERLARAARPAATVICTSAHPDDQVLLDFAAELGVPGFAGSEDDVMLRFLGAAERERADIVVRVTGDNPLTDPAAIDGMIDWHCRQGADYTYTEDLPRGTRPEVISVEALRRAHDLAEDPSGSEYMTLYFKQNPHVFRLVRWDGADHAVRRPQYRLTLDRPEDYDVVRRVYTELYRDGRLFGLDEVVRLLDGHPEWTAINAAIDPKVPPGLNVKLRNGV